MKWEVEQYQKHKKELEGKPVEKEVPEYFQQWLPKPDSPEVQDHLNRIIVPNERPGKTVFSRKISG